MLLFKHELKKRKGKLMRVSSFGSFKITNATNGEDISQDELDLFYSCADGDLWKPDFDEDYHCYSIDEAPYDYCKRYFTGFLDKKNKVIYEHDVLSNKNTVLVVVYSDRHAAFVCWNPNTDVFQTLPSAFDAHKNLRVIGNKFQNGMDLIFKKAKYSHD